jgi:hypothetical protein
LAVYSVVVVVEEDDPLQPTVTPMTTMTRTAAQADCLRRRQLKVKQRINASPKEASAMELVAERCPPMEPTTEPIAPPRAIKRLALASRMNPLVQSDPLVSILSWAVAAAVPEHSSLQPVDFRASHIVLHRLAVTCAMYAVLARCLFSSCSQLMSH